MPAAKIITPGDRFGRWTALEATKVRAYPSGQKVLHQSCRCDCGTTQFVHKYDLINGKSQHCGCLLPQRRHEGAVRHGHSIGNGTRVYRIWCNMLTRCTNPNVPHYERYGGRGITVCERWNSFDHFLEDMGEPPDGLTIDRLNNDGNYEPGNCAWATALSQARNKHNTIKLTFDGLTLTLVEWAKRLGIKYPTLKKRYHQKWPIEKMLTGSQKDRNLTRE